MKKKYWRSLECRDQVSDLELNASGEFPKGASVLEDAVSRRSFLKMMAGTVAFAGLAGCVRKPVQYIRPYAQVPEHELPGNGGLYYATAMALGTDVAGLLVKSLEGRPLKIEGNPGHPASLGKASTYHQASILSLYDPDRLKRSVNQEREDDLETFKSWMKKEVKGMLRGKGRGCALLFQSSMSPTFNRLIKLIKARYPEFVCFRYDALNDDNALQGVFSVTSEWQRPVYSFDIPDCIVAVGSDFLGSDDANVRSSKLFSERRDPDKKMNRLYVFEDRFSLTGAKADHRVRLKPSDMEKVVLAIFLEMKRRGYRFHSEVLNIVKSVPNLDKRLSDQVKVLVSDLLQRAGKGLLILGSGLSQTAHALGYLINGALGALGKSVTYFPLDSNLQDYLHTTSADSIKKLSGMILKGHVRKLFVLGSDPLYSVPQDLDMEGLFSRLQTVVSLSTYQTETALNSTWAVPRQHFLETWGDLQAVDGTVSIVQPLIRPLYDSMGDIDFLLALLGISKKSHDVVQNTWRSVWRGNFYNNWEKALHDGMVKSISKASSHSLKFSPLFKQSFKSDFRRIPTKFSGIEVSFHQDYSVYDGRFSNNSWLQEMPDPITKLTWDNAALISPSFAKKYQLKMGQMIELTRRDLSILTPVFVVPGHADDTVSLYLGYGKKSGKVSDIRGYNAHVFQELNGVNWVSGVSMVVSKDIYTLATTQEHGSMEGRPLYREASLADYKKNPDFAKDMVVAHQSESLWNEIKYDKGYQWGMVVDLSKCTGCNACVIACQAENNIPVVGKEEVLRGRELHWIRVDRYFEGEEDDARVVTQPVACMHCEQAPCEQVCPVAATVHTKDGLNDMIYNRCIGTRYCADNCPAKVRRFNFFDYHQRNPHSTKKERKHLFDYVREPEPSLQKMFNPNVTVRMRGVMEKCTYCVQRIRKVVQDCDNEGRQVRDGEVVTACQQSCPSEAIFFGDILDKKSKVHQLKSKERNYHLLEPLYLKERTTYLAGVVNKNPRFKT